MYHTIQTHLKQHRRLSSPRSTPLLLDLLARSLHITCSAPFPLGPLAACNSQRQEAFDESLLISAAIFSSIRRCPALARDPNILPAVLLGCCSENTLAARHAFAILVEQATHSPDVVSQVHWSREGVQPIEEETGRGGRKMNLILPYGLTVLFVLGPEFKGSVAEKGISSEITKRFSLPPSMLGSRGSLGRLRN